MALVVCVGAGPGAGVAHAEEAQYGETRGAASILLGLEYARTEAPTAADDLTNTVSLQTRLRGVLGRRIGPLFGAGFALGGGLGGGFAYGFELDLVGLGWRFSRGGFAGVVAGGGFSGVTGHIPFALQTPIELVFETDLGQRARLVAWGRAAWTFAADARADGAAHAPFGDELAAGIGLRLGKRIDFGDGGAGSGYLVGLSYREQLGTRFFGLLVAFELSAGSRR